MIKLDAMENPFALPEGLRQSWAEYVAASEINRYPDSDMLELRQAIAEHEGVEANQVLLGNGSDEIIQMLLIACEPGTCVVPSPTFVMYNLISRWLKRPVANVELLKDFSLSADTFLQVCAREKASIAFLACPNNPTGNLWSQETVEKIAKNFKGLLIIDEAYAPFSSRSHTSLIESNTVILRTFSKIGWAGLRLGYLLGTPEIIAHLNKVRMPYNINVLTQASAKFLLQHSDLFRKQAEVICKQRKVLSKSLSAIAQLEVFPSETNFLLVRVPDATATFAALKAKGILIKSMHGQHPLLAQCLRITIGTSEENQSVIQAFKEIFE
ncbi:MAG: histidinol-phosphate transaminase [Zetaproteobacteria bacterium CG1_02_49_23]|nr:MAG: histidinol-phosphate transaminase [Zetaproteobacteria bacterium CG1_02_49_23]